MRRIIFFLFGILLFGSSAMSQAVISAEKPTYDFGKISLDKGAVTCNFVVKNTGNADLVINNVTASCGCTTPTWTKSPIAPGATGTVTTTFKPSTTGPFSKTVSVFSNGKEGALVLTLKGEVIADAKTTQSLYPIQMGDFRLKSSTLAFNNLSNKQSASQYIQVYNSGSAPLTISFGNVPQYMTITPSPATLAAGQEGGINIAFDAAKAKKYGLIFNEIDVLVNGKKGANQTIKTTATVVDDFSTLTSAQRENSPVLSLNPAYISFDNISKENSKVLRISNTGKSNLMIRDIVSSSDAITISQGKKEIKPGETANYKIAIDSKKVFNGFSGFVTIIANDPNNPSKVVYLSIKSLS